MRTRIKICGLTQVDNALETVAAGADAIGLVFYPPSPRNVELAQAQKIAQALPPFVSKVALVVNPSREQVQQIIDSVDIDVLQFHGDEDNEFCNSFAKPWYKAIRVKDQQAVNDALTQFPDAKALLLDAFVEGVPGGTGEKFDWSLVPTNGPEIILAGGLNPDNVEQAVNTAKPYAVDVSGGVEASKGIKDPIKMNQFVMNVMRADIQSA